MVSKYCPKCKKDLDKKQFYKNTSYCIKFTAIHNKKRNEIRKKKLKESLW